MLLLFSASSRCSSFLRTLLSRINAIKKYAAAYLLNGLFIVSHQRRNSTGKQLIFIDGLFFSRKTWNNQLFRFNWTTSLRELLVLIVELFFFFVCFSFRSLTAGRFPTRPSLIPSVSSERRTFLDLILSGRSRTFFR